MEAVKRFWNKVNLEMGQGNGTCWEWKGARDKDGYGRMRFDKGYPTGTHQISWILHNGILPTGLFVLHRCDNPPCVNPAHLFLGDNGDNQRDAVAKGRHKGGNNKKLTEAQVREIRQRSKEPRKSLAAEYGVSRWAIKNIFRKGPTRGWAKLQ